MQPATKAGCSADLSSFALWLNWFFIRAWCEALQLKLNTWELFIAQLLHPPGCTCHVCSRRLWKKGQTVLHGHCRPLKSLTGVNWPYWLALMRLLFVWPAFPISVWATGNQTCSIVINRFWMQGPLHNVVWSVWAIKAVNRGSCNVCSSALIEPFYYCMSISSPGMWWWTGHVFMST